MTMAAIETVALTKAYKDVVAVKDLTMRVEEGEIFALLGVNGAGKTTTVKMLSGLTTPTSGEARVMGYSVTKDLSEVKKRIDVSMQETAIARKLTVEENLLFYASLNGLDKSERGKTLEEIYREFGLDSVKDKRAAKLSGGWQRKLSIALALVSRPAVLFLDEPTLGLDVLARRELWRVIEGLRGKVTIVLTTHYMEEAEALADRIAVMKDGTMRFVGTKEEMYAQTGATNVEESFVRIIEGGDVYA